MARQNALPTGVRQLEARQLSIAVPVPPPPREQRWLDCVRERKRPSRLREPVGCRLLVSAGMEISCAFPPGPTAVDHIVEAEQLGYKRAWLYDSPALYGD